MSIKLPGITVLDFDGTVTDTQKESKGVIASYTRRFVEMVGIDRSTLSKLLEKEEQKILNTPGKYGWEYNDLIVAPAVSDPYVLHTVKLTNVIKELRRGNLKVDLPLEDDVGEFLNRIYFLSYPDAGIHFKLGAREFIESLRALGEVVVVTNSQTKEVLKKLNALLGGDNGLRVIGNAKKYEVDPDWAMMDESTKPTPKFPRPVYLRRRKYYEALDKLGNVRRVVGDIYELDLALPEAMGLTTVLVVNTTTPKWETDHYANHQNGFLAESLEDIIPWLLDAK